MLVDLTGSARIDAQQLVHQAALVVVHRVERVGPEQVLEALVVRHVGLAHQMPPSVTPDAVSSLRSRFSPARIRLLTVPSASPSIVATSRYVCPPK